MNVDELIDALLNGLASDKLTGREQIVDPAIFAITGFETVKMHDGSQYLVFTSDEYKDSQNAEPTSFS